jgi:D-alanyl-lipoteichoic acid acyltransferase DltB (MBOAT superfamily)
MENFKSPYLAISPSDFWRRWHISLSSWIHDYLYIPLGGSRVNTKWKFALVLLTSLGLSGLWHGAAWNFIVWGIYHAILIFAYHSLGIGGRWTPDSRMKIFLAWLVMLCFTMVGWVIFRSSNLGWLTAVFTQGFSTGTTGDSLVVSLVVLVSVAFYSLPLFALMFLDRVIPNRKFINATAYSLVVIIIMTLFRESQQDFIYFQF